MVLMAYYEHRHRNVINREDKLKVEAIMNRYLCLHHAGEGGNRWGAYQKDIWELRKTYKLVIHEIGEEVAEAEVEAAVEAERAAKAKKKKKVNSKNVVKGNGKAKTHTPEPEPEPEPQEEEEEEEGDDDAEEVEE